MNVGKYGKEAERARIFSFHFISFKNHTYNNINELRTTNIYIFQDVAGFLFLLRETSK